MNPKVKFITLGCKVNQYETHGMREAMEKAGAETVVQQADFVVINTCTVTEEADKENRYWIRRARRENPNAKIIVTGCGVERNRADYESLPETNRILRNHEKADIAQLLLEGCASPAVQEGNPKHRFTPLSISRTEGQGRAFVKIQDGCNHACSFCKVVLVRGRSRTRDLHDVVEEVIRLRDSGYREIVFAGIQLGAYDSLIELLEKCSEVEGIERLRLSSIEPTDVKPELIRALAELPKCVPHLHIPLQSGDDEILKRMNRRYGRAFYRDLIFRLKDAMPDFSLTLDVMAGFPGEDEIHFQNTVDLLEAVKPLKCHVFPYSAREGTRAAQWENVPAKVQRERVRILMGKAEGWSREVRAPFLNYDVPVLVEHFKDGRAFGLTPNYLKVSFPGFEEQVSQIVSVKLLALSADGFDGEMTGEK